MLIAFLSYPPQKYCNNAFDDTSKKTHCNNTFDNT